MKRILFVTPRYPSPPVKGDQLRAYHQIRVLSRDHQVTLLSFDKPPTIKHRDSDVSGFCKRVIWTDVGGLERILRLPGALVTGLPLQVAYYRSHKVQALVDRELESGAHDLVVVQLIRMASYFDVRRSVPCVIDLVDSSAMSMQARAKFAPVSTRWIWTMEARRAGRYERQAIRWFDAAFAVSELDRERIDGGQGHASLKVASNGVDLEYFTAHPGERDPATLIFFGNMGFFPNVDAAIRLADEILPRLRRARPDARLILLGANPHARVHALSSRTNGIEVTGYVPDLRPFLRRATLAIFPIELGSGMQNKVLEAMASGLPVVATPFVLNGIQAQPGVHLRIGRSSDEIAAIAGELLGDADQRSCLAANARKFVEGNYSWEANVKQILSTIDPR